MKAVFVKAPYQFEVRDVQLREMGPTDALIRIKACGICGTDLHTASTEAKDWLPFGHEISGVVEKVGSQVKHVKPGDHVALESGSFCRECDLCRNGRVDLCNGSRNMFQEASLGFAEYIVVSHECLVPIGDMPFDIATMIEPLGVALDLLYTADVRIGEDVLVVGLGPIGLMALRLAKLAGARRLYAADRFRNTRRIEIARLYGADEVIYTDQTELRDYAFEKGGVDKVLVTAPPRVIPQTFEVTSIGGTVAFIGIEYGAGATICFDANAFHFRKMSLKASYAAPALFFPRCIDFINSGAIDLEPLVSNRFRLEDTGAHVIDLRDNKAGVIKSIMIND